MPFIFLLPVLYVKKLINYRLFKYFRLIARGIINTIYAIDLTSFANVIAFISQKDYYFILQDVIAVKCFEARYILHSLRGGPYDLEQTLLCR